MAEWLVEKLDEIVEFGYQKISLSQEFSHVDTEYRETLLEQEYKSNQDQLRSLPLGQGRRGALLEQEGEQDDDYGFDRDWIIEFRQSMPPDDRIDLGRKHRKQAKRGRLREK